MDIIFQCPKCDQELAVDSSGAGSEITCPACSEKIVIPATETATAAAAAVSPLTGHDPAHPVNPIASSAAARVEMHLKVPVHAGPTASLIGKAKPPLEVAAKETDKKLRVKTIRHTDCVEVGHDRFDEMISSFLQKVGEQNITNISPMTYTYLDIGSQKLLTDYAVMIIYRG